LLRLGQAAAGAEELSTVDLSKADPRVRGEIELLRSACLERSGKTLQGRQAFEEARSSVFTSGCSELVCEFQYYDALGAWNVGDFDQSESTIRSSLDAVQEPSGVDYTLALPVLRARSLQLLSNIHATREDYAEQAATLEKALDQLDTAKTPDVYTEAALIMNYSTLVRELDAVDGEPIRTRYRRIEWTPFLSPLAFHIMRSLGWFNALRGDHLGAFRDLRDAGAIAKTPTLVLTAILDRALLAQGLNEQLTAREELERAQDIAARIDWNAVTSDERLALLMLAQVLSPVKPRAARVALDRYRGITSKISTMHVARFDRRLKADELFTEGLVAKAEGLTNQAVDPLVAAFDIWASIGYRWRAALAAIELAELTRDSRYTGFAAAEAIKHPSSWLAQRINGRDASAGYSSLH
jgi:tetratricopeptide (TPR) repeat protein